MIDTPKLALYPGKPGHFDCDGALSGSFVRYNKKNYIYYAGWQNLPNGLWSCNTGRLQVDVDALTLTREFDGPVFGRDKDHPLFACATAFYVKGNSLQAWYNSGIHWRKNGQDWKVRYGLSYAHSQNGVDWTCRPGLCLPFIDDNEYAFGRPSVLFWEDTYFMWYAHRAVRGIDAYRMGLSTSSDGIHWQRHDELSGIDVSPSGWDNEMVCYPCVFEHKGILYMLYNGNNYGETGFGLAIMDGT